MASSSCPPCPFDQFVCERLVEMLSTGAIQADEKAVHAPGGYTHHDHGSAIDILALESWQVGVSEQPAHFHMEDTIIRIGEIPCWVVFPGIDRENGCQFGKRPVSERFLRCLGTEAGVRQKMLESPESIRVRVGARADKRPGGFQLVLDFPMEFRESFNAGRFGQEIPKVTE